MMDTEKSGLGSWSSNLHEEEPSEEDYESYREAEDRAYKQLGRTFDSEAFDQLFDLLLIGGDNPSADILQYRARIVEYVSTLVYSEVLFPQSRDEYNELGVLLQQLGEFEAALRSVSDDTRQSLDMGGWSPTTTGLLQKFVEMNIPANLEGKIEVEVRLDDEERFQSPMEPLYFLLQGLRLACMNARAAMPQHHSPQSHRPKKAVLASLTERLVEVFWELVDARLHEFVRHQLDEAEGATWANLSGNERSRLYEQLKTTLRKKRTEFVRISLELGGYEMANDGVQTRLYQQKLTDVRLPHFPQFKKRMDKELTPNFGHARR